LKLEEAISKFKPKVEEALKAIFDEKIEKAKAYGDENARFYENLKEFVLRGGKRLRPITLIMAYHAIRKPEEELDELVKASTCVELLHNSTLVHDDIIDQDELRRGGPTFHVKYERLLGQRAPPKARLLGLAMGILGGDELFNMGFEVLLNAKFENIRVIRALGHYVNAYRKVVNGELLDLIMSIEDYGSLSLEDYMVMIDLKTAALFKESIRIGATLAGADDEITNGLSEYGELVARAFQIQDDILGIYGDEKTLGKPIGSDLREGKATILVIKALEALRGKEKEQFLSLLGRGGITVSEVNMVRDLLKTRGILKEVQGLSEALIEKAKGKVRCLDIREEAREYFLNLADFMIRRRY